MKITGDVSAKSYRKQLADKGVFHTDEALAKEIASYIPEGITEVYDPTCGCGALLSVFPDSVKKYGQELDPDMAEYCRQHLTNCEIAAGDTLEKPAFLSRSFPAIVANYPFSIKWNPENACERPFYCLNVPVLPPKGKADYAFLCHILFMLADNGVASVLCSPGIGYRGGAEAKLRKWLIDTGWIEKVVLYEGDHFQDTKIATMLLVIRKDKKTQDITFCDHEAGIEKTVGIEEIQKNDYTLAVNRYVERPKKPEEFEGKPLSELQSDLMGLNLNAFRQSCELDWIMLTQITGHDYQIPQFRSYLEQVKSIADEYIAKLDNLPDNADKKEANNGESSENTAGE